MKRPAAKADEARIAWYREMCSLLRPGEGFVPLVLELEPEEAARLAAHFGRLAMGENDGEEAWIRIAAQDAADAKTREYALLAERDALKAQMETAIVALSGYRMAAKHKASLERLSHD